MERAKEETQTSPGFHGDRPLLIDCLVQQWRRQVADPLTFSISPRLMEPCLSCPIISLLPDPPLSLASNTD